MVRILRRVGMPCWKPPTGGWDDAGVADLPVTPGCEESQAFPFTSGPLANGIVLAGCGQWPNATPDTYFYSATSNTWSGPLMVAAFTAGMFSENMSASRIRNGPRSSRSASVGV